jgi:hypothetical protein
MALACHSGKLSASPTGRSLRVAMQASYKQTPHGCVLRPLTTRKDDRWLTLTCHCGAIPNSGPKLYPRPIAYPDEWAVEHHYDGYCALPLQCG